MGDIDYLRSLTYHSTALEQAQEHTTFSASRSRSAHGRLYPNSPPEVVDCEELSNYFHDQEDFSSTYGEVLGEDIANVFKDANPLRAEQDEKDNGDDREGNNIWSLNISQGGLQDQNISLWSNNIWSASATQPSFDAAPPIALPAPNDLTSTYLPFSSHLALTNHFTPSTLDNFQILHTPVFLHSVLQLPSTLAQILSLRISDILCHLSPAILLNHTTTLDAATLLPSLVPATTFSTYHHVNGLLYFPQGLDVMEKISDFLAITHNTKSEMREVQTQIQDSEGKRHDINAWAWVAVTAEGAEEWWTLEDFVAGRIVGLGTVEW